MSAGGAFFNGRFIRTPGSESRVDASGLEQIGLGAIGTVAIVGTGVGGIPSIAINEVADFIRLRRPEKVRDTFRSGDLREAGCLVFDPSRDPEIGAGAVELIAMKVNPATQSTLTLSNAAGGAITLTSRDYGAFTSQINVEIVNGTVQGKLVSVVFEDTLESADNIGGDAAFSLQYTEEPNLGWDTMTGQVISSGIRASGTRAEPGLFSDVTLGAAGVLTAVSANAADIGLRLAVYGLVAGVPTREVLVLNGTTPVSSVNAYSINGVFACELLDSVALGNVTVRDSAVATLLTITAGARARGGVRATTMPLNTIAATLVADAASTNNVWIVGHNASGAIVIARTALTGTTPVNTAITNFTDIIFIVLGELAIARTVTISGVSVATLNTVQNTLLKAADYFNARQVGAFGFVFTLLTGLTTLAVSELDTTATAVTIVASPVSFFANLFFLIDYFNSTSALVEATRATNGTGFPDNTTTPQFLGGGIEGVTLFSHWQDALDKLKMVRVNMIAILNGDPAVHAALEAHLRYRAGAGKSEASGYIGLQNAGLTAVPTLAEIRSQILALNSRHLQAFAQEIDIFTTAGELTAMPPYFLGVVAAGMAAGAPIGVSLTHKIANVQEFRQNTSWNPAEDSEEMIEAGLCFLESVDNVGRRFVRNITTHLSTSNLAFIEASVNQAANFAVFTLRTQMEFFVGKRGFAGTLADAKSKAQATLGLLGGDPDPILTSWRALDLELAADIMELSVEIAPVVPINFVLSTIHLVAQRLAA